MSESVSATLTFEENVLRYAELERRDQAHRLLRIGSETFPFDLKRALLQKEADEGQVRRVEETLLKVFDGAEARDLRIVLHPVQGYSFFTPISSEVPVRERKRQLRRQAALVTGARSKEDLYMTSETVRTTQDSNGEPFMWVHVLALPMVVNERITDIVEKLPMRGHGWIVSSEAASRVTRRVERTGGSAQEALRPYTLAVGQYATHTEYSLSRNREWYHAHYAEEAYSAENRTYFAIGFLNRVDVSLDGVGRLFAYGTNVDLEAYRPFESIFGKMPEVLDPLRVVENDTGHEPDDPSSFTPSIGAGMGDYM